MFLNPQVAAPFLMSARPLLGGFPFGYFSLFLFYQYLSFATVIYVAQRLVRMLIEEKVLATMIIRQIESKINSFSFVISSMHCVMQVL
jgi:hypothetical protein